MSLADDRGTYLLGHSDDELARLERQARLFAEATEDGLRRAGLGTGMRVLDLGCGVGDVTMAAARLVGPQGSVLGVDLAGAAVATANRRAEALGLGQARCVEGDGLAIDPAGFDAVVGRFLLMHFPDPGLMLAHLRNKATPGTVVAFLEMDVSSASIHPPLPLFQAGVQAVCDVYRAVGAEPDMGSRLYGAFRRAGLSPHLQGSCKVVGGNDPDVFDYLARSVSSLAPAMRTAGVLPASLDPDRFRDQLAEAAAAADYSVSYPRFVCAWATV